MDKVKHNFDIQNLKNVRSLSAIVMVVLLLVCVISHALISESTINSIPMIILRVITLIACAVFTYSKKTLVAFIFFAMILGIEVGLDIPTLGREMDFLSDIFLRLVKTIVAPIIFTTLVVGIASHADVKQVGRMAVKSIIYFEVITTIALFLGLAAINISKAGVGISRDNNINVPSANAPLTWKQIITHSFPENIVKPIYSGEILPIVIFTVLFGVATILLPQEKTRNLLNVIETISNVMFKFTALIMYTAPFGVFGAIANTVSKTGFETLIRLFMLLATLYVSLIFLVTCLLLPIVVFYAKIPLRKFIAVAGGPALLAFTTSSSESAMPILIDRLTNILKIRRNVVTFVLPMSYSFNLDGSTLYLTLATIFVAQATGMDMPIATQLWVLLTLVLSSKGIAGVPRATLVILIGTCKSFGIEEWPIGLIVGIDAFMDMGRSLTNVIGNTVATCVIARSENAFVTDEFVE